MADNQALRATLHRLQYLMELARLEVSNIEATDQNIAEELGRRLEDSVASMSKFMEMAGPGGYDPGANFEKCDCGHWRLKKSKTTDWKE